MARFARRATSAGPAGGHEAHADHRHSHCDSCCDDGADDRPRGFWPRVRTAVAYGFVTLPEDIGRSMLVGLLLAAAITAVVPEDFFTGVLSGGIVAMLAMMVLGIPVYVCATASVPVAAALIARGVSPGVALVFLMTGPATNAATIATIWRTMGRRTAVLYLASVAGTALASGFLLDYIYVSSGAQPGMMMGWMLPGWLKPVLAVILLAVLAVGAVRSILPRHRHIVSPKDMAEFSGGSLTELKVDGMTCNHCRAAVLRALEGVAGSESVSVDLRGGRAVVAGKADVDELVKAVESLGYVAEVVEAGPGQEAD